jgi:transcriptional regulator with GAF, ATPase, and Fis domain
LANTIRRSTKHAMLIARREDVHKMIEEIGDTSLPLQVRLLRVLQERVFTPLGDTAERKTDVRLIAATNKDLEAMVAAGTFREELFYRLNIVPIYVPPLRRRREDIPMHLPHPHVFVVRA